jgi:hypothetical protein
VQHLFNSTNKEIIYVLSIPMIRWQETTVAVKKKALPLFVSVNALLFSMQYRHASFSFVLQPETITEAGKSLTVHIKATLIRKFCFLDIS